MFWMFFVRIQRIADLSIVVRKTDVFMPYVEVMYIKINYAIIDRDTLGSRDKSK